MFKKVICLFVCLVMIFGITACKKNPDVTSSTVEPVNSQETGSADDVSDTNKTYIDEETASEDSLSEENSSIGDILHEENFSGENEDNKIQNGGESAASDENSSIDNESSEDNSSNADKDSYSSNVSSEEQTVSKPEIDAVKDEIKKGRYSYVWGDEFNGKALDLKKWGFDQGALPGDLVMPRDNKYVNLADGNLRLLFDKHFDYSNKDIKYAVSPIIYTANTMNFTYGYLELRARVPYQHSAWPAFWLMNGNLDEKRENRRYGVEIDIFEIFSSHDTATTTVYKHYADGEGSQSVVVGEYSFEDYVNLSDEYHIYGFEWTPEKMIFSIDGEEYCELDITEDGNFDGEGFSTDMRGFHEGLHIKLSMSAFTPQTSWQLAGATIDHNTQFPIEYDIDWIRLYQDSSMSGTELILGE